MFLLFLLVLWRRFCILNAAFFLAFGVGLARIMVFCDNFILRFFSAVILGMILLACAGDPPPLDNPVIPVEQAYNEALLELEEGVPETAAKKFRDIERYYPYSILAPRSQLMAAYSYYIARKYDEAELELDLFIERYPASPHLAYALYFRGITHYERIGNVNRDARYARMALRDFLTVIERFPESPFGSDAVVKGNLASNYLAGHEMSVGRYYQKQEFYSAALGRFNYVVAEYFQSSFVPEALHRQTEIYLALGLPSEAQRSARVLADNYPESIWYRHSWNLLRQFALLPAATTRSSVN